MKNIFSVNRPMENIYTSDSRIPIGRVYGAKKYFVTDKQISHGRFNKLYVAMGNFPVIHKGREVLIF